MTIKLKAVSVAAAIAIISGLVSGPAAAEKSIVAGSSRGKINIYISNSRTPGVCTYKLTGSNLAPNQHIFLGSSWNTGTGYDLIGYINGDSTISNYLVELPTYKYNRSYRMTMFKWDYWAIADVYGNPAAIGVSNNCA